MMVDALREESEGGGVVLTDPRGILWEKIQILREGRSIKLEGKESGPAG